MKQSAVEWFNNELDDILELYPSEWDVIQKNFIIAKEMEKEQIIDAGNNCAFKQHLHSDRINKMNEAELRQFAEEEHLTFGEEHYNETFKNK